MLSEAYTATKDERAAEAARSVDSMRHRGAVDAWNSINCPVSGHGQTASECVEQLVIETKDVGSFVRGGVFQGGVGFP